MANAYQFDKSRELLRKHVPENKNRKHVPENENWSEPAVLAWLNDSELGKASTGSAHTDGISGGFYGLLNLPKDQDVKYRELGTTVEVTKALMAEVCGTEILVRGLTKRGHKVVSVEKRGNGRDCDVTIEYLRPSQDGNTPATLEYWTMSAEMKLAVRYAGVNESALFSRRLSPRQQKSVAAGVTNMVFLMEPVLDKEQEMVTGLKIAVFDAVTFLEALPESGRFEIDLSSLTDLEKFGCKHERVKKDKMATMSVTPEAAQKAVDLLIDEWLKDVEAGVTQE